MYVGHTKLVSIKGMNDTSLYRLDRHFVDRIVCHNIA